MTLREVEDCRHNGDAYGIELITCKSCGWSISNKFDDAAKTYYYETAYRYFHNAIAQPQAVKVKPQSEPLITIQLEKSFAKIVKIRLPRDAIRQAMVLGRIREKDIEAFMIKYHVPA